MEDIVECNCCPLKEHCGAYQRNQKDKTAEEDNNVLLFKCPLIRMLGAEIDRYK